VGLREVRLRSECSCNPMKAVFTFDCDFCCGNLTVTVEEVEESGV
jgi:hypothetical protein